MIINRRMAWIGEVEAKNTWRKQRRGIGMKQKHTVLTKKAQLEHWKLEQTKPQPGCAILLETKRCQAPASSFSWEKWTGSPLQKSRQPTHVDGRVRRRTRKSVWLTRRLHIVIYRRVMRNALLNCRSDSHRNDNQSQNGLVWWDQS
jgi:hypothetical protein